MKQPLAKLQKIELRDARWHEALDFTNWLAEEANLSLLSEEIGLEIKFLKTEANVGRFSVDILAEEEWTDKKIIIENQLEDTDHDHLGKIITYASGYDAEVIIRIVKNVRKEHQRAIERLNEHTDQKIAFFLIKIELWKIWNSDPAPKFEIVVSPNEWAKAIKTNSNNWELTNTKLQQLEFWTKFKNYMNIYNNKIRLQSPRPQHWYNVSVWNADFHIALTVDSRENLLACGIRITKNKNLFNFLQEQKENIERQLWESADRRWEGTTSSIKIKQSFPNILNQEGHDEHFNWLNEKIVLFKDVFSPYLKEFKNK